MRRGRESEQGAPQLTMVRGLQFAIWLTISIGTLGQGAFQPLFTCDIRADDNITECVESGWLYEESSYCDNESDVCMGGDCWDCDPCPVYAGDCARCLYAGCSFCPLDGSCAFEPLDYISPNNNRDLPTCLSLDPSAWIWNITDLTICGTGDSVFSDPLYALNEWAYDIMNVQGAWRRGFTGSGVRIRINADGVAADHPELTGRFDVNASCDAFFSLEYDEENPGVRGTVVASIAAASADNGEGGVGIAPGATLSACEVQFGEDAIPFLGVKIEDVDISVNPWSFASCSRRVDGEGRRLQQPGCPFTYIFFENPCEQTMCEGLATGAEVSSECADYITAYYCKQFLALDSAGCDAFFRFYQVDCDFTMAINEFERQEESLIRGVEEGRGGLGVIYVFAAGDDYGIQGVNSQLYLNSRYTISVGAVERDGMRGNYSNVGAPLFISAPGGDALSSSNWLAAYPPVLGGGYEYSTFGTSFACAAVAGVIALLLEANPSLGWRDVQGILASTARLPDDDLVEFSINGAGLHHANEYGFGVVDADAAVAAALGWINYGPEITFAEKKDASLSVEDFVRVKSAIDFGNDDRDFVVETVRIDLELDHFSRGDLEIVLTSPSGTSSILQYGYSVDDSLSTGPWSLSTVRNMGESAYGTWVLSVEDQRQGNLRTCANLDFTLSSAAGLITCQSVESGGGCIDGVPVQNFLQLLRSSDQNGMSALDACCVCGGGRRSARNILDSWTLNVFGRSAEASGLTESPTASAVPSLSLSPTRSAMDDKDELLLPFGAEVRDSFIGGNDDGSSPAIFLRRPMKFFGEEVNQFFLNTNGVVSFDSAYSAFTPEEIPSSDVPGLIAVFWCDINTSQMGMNENELWVGVSTAATDLAVSSSAVNGHPDGESFTADFVAVATWHRVASINSGPERNSFQAALAYNRDETWVILSYSRLEFSNDQAGIGFNSLNGQVGESVSVIATTEDLAMLLSSSNCGLEGVYVYKVSEIPARKLPFAFGGESGDTLLPIGASSVAFSLPQPMLFFEQNETNVFLNVHGHVSLGRPYNSSSPVALPDPSIPSLAAAYWTRISDGEILGRVSFDDSDLFTASDIVNSHLNRDGFMPDYAVVATWHDAVFSESFETNSFQAVLAYNTNTTWAIFSYSKLEFHRSGATIGFNGADGSLGYSERVITDLWEIDALLDGTNCNLPGTYVFEVAAGDGGGNATPPPTSTDDLPFPFGSSTEDISVTNEGGGNTFDLEPPLLYFGSPVTYWSHGIGGQIFLEGGDISIYDVYPDTETPVMGVNEMFARTSTAGSDLDIADAIVSGHPEGGSFTADVVAVATWHMVAPFGGAPERNSFQAGLAYNSAETWVILAYARLETLSYTHIQFIEYEQQTTFVAFAADDNAQDIQALLNGTNCGLSGVYTYRVPNSVPRTEDALPLPFGVGVGDTFVVADDGSSGAFALPREMKFFGETVSQFFMNTDGYLTFDSSFSSSLTPFLPNPSAPGMAAVYWTDITTTTERGIDDNELWAGASTVASDIIAASTLVNDHPEGGSFWADAVAVATWHKVSARNEPYLRSSFQAVVAYDDEETWIIFGYSRLEFARAGSFDRAIIGFNSLSGNFGEELYALREVRYELLWDTNCGMPGVYAYKVSQAPVRDNDTLPLPFGSSAGDTFVPGNDDGSSSRIVLPQPMLLYGQTMSEGYLNTNGIISFDVPFSLTLEVDIPSIFLPPLIAAFATDIDTRNRGRDDNELWIRTSLSETDLVTASSVIRGHPDGKSFVAEAIAVATWHRVAAFGGGSGRNSFQSVLAYSDEETWVILGYSRLEFFNKGARIGFNSVDGFGQSVASIESNLDMTTLLLGTNCDVTGVYAYKVSDRPFYGSGSLPLAFGVSSNDTSLAGSDDGSSQAFVFPQVGQFFGEEVFQCYVNANGLLTFNSPYSSSTPVHLPDPSAPALIAVYWADLDTRANATDENELWARTSTDPTDLSDVSSLVNGHSDGGEFIPVAVFVATWYKVAAYGGGTERNTFQVVIAFSGATTWVIFAYAQLESYVSGAAVGFNGHSSEAGETVTIVDSGPELVELVSGTNCGVSGVYAFDVTENPQRPSLSSVPSISVAPSSSPTKSTRFECDLVEDDSSCPFVYDGTCDKDLSLCASGDCWDCDPCRQFDFDCSRCVSNHCSWCPLNGFCAGQEIDYLSPRNSFGVPACTTDSPDSWITEPVDDNVCYNISRVYSQPLYEANLWAYQLLNVEAAWQRGYTGVGVRVRINDEGVAADHPDYARRFAVDSSCNNFSPENPDGSSPEAHGTAMASIVASGGNTDSGTVGIAPGVILSACPVDFSSSFLNTMVDQMEISVNGWSVGSCEYLDARHRNLQDSDCPFSGDSESGSPCFSSFCDFSAAELNKRCESEIVDYCTSSLERDTQGCSQYLYLFADCDYATSNRFFDEQEAGLIQGITDGRSGRGIIYVFPSGDGFAVGEDVNSALFLNSRYTIAVAAVGKDGLHASYSSGGAAVLVSGPGGDVESFTNWITADFGGGYRDATYGTSFACASVAGVAALVLQANPRLGWRDVQGILASAARMVANDTQAEFTMNAAGLQHSYEYGFGIVDADAALAAALNWTVYTAEQDITVQVTPDAAIEDDASLTTSSNATIDLTGFVVETVQVDLEVEHLSRGDLHIVLTSPSGTESILHPGPRPENTFSNNPWIMSTVRSMGESAFGTWTLSISDKRKSDEEQCADLEYQLSFIGEKDYMTCSLAASEFACYDGTPSPQFSTILDSLDTSGVSAKEACCVCGGGQLVGTSVLRSWTLHVFGRLGEVPSTPQPEVTNTTLISSPVETTNPMTTTTTTSSSSDGTDATSTEEALSEVNQADAVAPADKGTRTESGEPVTSGDSQRTLSGWFVSFLWVCAMCFF